MTDQKKPAAKAAPKHPPRSRADKDAVEMDYRLAKLTLRQIADKHQTRPATVLEWAKKFNWQRDLSAQVRAATRAAVLAETVTAAVTEANQTRNDGVAAAAELNKNIILGHRTRLANLLKDADTASAKLMTLAQSVADVREASVLVGAIESLTRTTKSIIDKEREAYGLNDEGDKASELESLSDEELDARIAEHLARRK